jgi:hypothetical protein
MFQAEKTPCKVEGYETNKCILKHRNNPSLVKVHIVQEKNKRKKAGEAKQK